MPIRRLIRALLAIGLFLGVIALLARFVAIPYAEDRAAEAIGSRLGAPVSVHADPSLGPGLMQGDVGTLDVHAKRLEREGLTLSDVHARIHDASADLGKLVGGTVRVHFSGIDLSGKVSEGSLAHYLRLRLQGGGVAGASRLRVRIRPGVLVAVLPRGQVPLTVTVIGPTTVRIAPAIGGPLGRALGSVLGTPVDLAPLPYGIHLRSVTLMQGAALVTAGRGAGTQTLED